jgi:hypothetical protein
VTQLPVVYDAAEPREQRVERLRSYIPEHPNSNATMSLKSDDLRAVFAALDEARGVQERAGVAIDVLTRLADALGVRDRSSAVNILMAVLDSTVAQRADETDDEYATRLERLAREARARCDARDADEVGT